MFAKLLLSMLFFLLAGLCNGCMDLIKDHFKRSIFAKVRYKGLRKWFYSDWHDHYIDGNPRNGVVKLFEHVFGWQAPGFLGRIPCPAPLWDGWHFFKFLMLIFLYATIAVWFPVSFIMTVLLGILFFLIWGFGFNIMYEYIGRQPQYRRNYFKSMWDFSKRD